MFKFLRSSHKGLYIMTAIKFGCSPDLVYDIAHGKNVESNKVSEIRSYLVEKKLIKRRRYKKTE